MLNYQVKIGLAPMRRDVTPRPGIFNWEKAEERGRAAVEYIEKHFASENVSFVDLKGINPVDVMYCEADAEKVIERFNQEKVDAVFIINCNFGNEEVAAHGGHGAWACRFCIWAPAGRRSLLPDGSRSHGQPVRPVRREPPVPAAVCAFRSATSRPARVESDPTFAEGLRQVRSASACMVKNFTRDAHRAGRSAARSPSAPLFSMRAS